MTFPMSSLTVARKFTLRPFRESDYLGVAALYIQHDMEFIGSTNMSEAMVRESWGHIANFDPFASVVVAESDDGEIVGMAQVMATQPVPVRPFNWVMALPAWSDIAAPALIEWSIDKAREVIARVPEHARVVLQGSANSHNQRMADAYRAFGAVNDRGFYSMLIEFDGTPPPAPNLPDGIRLVTFAEYPHVEAFARAIKEGFADHRGSTADMPMDYYIERVQKNVHDPKFDEATWWLALDDADRIAGVCTSWMESEEYENTAYIAQLAVLPDFRRRGLAVALLHTAFGEHFKRGRSGVSLGVDGASLTNAVAMYERAGMKIGSRWDVFEIELRPGEEITNQ